MALSDAVRRLPRELQRRETCPPPAYRRASLAQKAITGFRFLINDTARTVYMAFFPWSLKNFLVIVTFCYWGKKF